VRFTATSEIRPDLLFSEGSGRWVGVEVQRRIDTEKARRWPLLCSIQNDRHGAGDLIVITHRRSVARWARRVATARGPLGSRLSFTPVVLSLAEPANLARLLDAARPELAFFAAWAMHARHGSGARAVVVRSLDLSRRLAPALQAAQIGAILKVLSERMLAFLAEVEMDPEKLPESPHYRKFREALEARGEARALFALLKLRGIVPTEDERLRITSCTDAAMLERWIVQAADARSIADVFRD
jgi:hypothetical protein